mgnify:FL=1
MNTSGGIASAIEDIQNRKEGSDSMGEGGIGDLLIGEGGLLFDTSSPKTMAVDAGILALTAFPPAAIAARLIQAGYKGAKLTKALNQVKKAQESIPKTGLGFKGSGRMPTFMQLSIPEEVAALSSMADGGVVYASKGRFIFDKIKQILGKDKKKKDDAPEKKGTSKDGVDEGSGTGDVTANRDTLLNNPLTRNPFKTLTGGAILSELTGLTNFTRSSSDPETKEIVSIQNNNRNGNPKVESEEETILGSSDETIGDYAKSILIGKGFTLNADGKLIDKDNKPPKFLDYVNAFGKGYMEKVADNPDFAKKMMAGFAAMGRGREGPVPLSPLGISEFTEGYLGEDASQRASVPAAIATLEYLKDNPEQKDLYLRQLAASQGFTLDDVDISQSRDLYEQTFVDYANRAGIDIPFSDLTKNYMLVDDKNNIIDSTKLAAETEEDLDYLEKLKIVKKTKPKE